MKLKTLAAISTLLILVSACGGGGGSGSDASSSADGGANGGAGTAPLTMSGRAVTVVSSTPVTASTTSALAPSSANVNACPLPATITGNIATAVKTGNALIGPSADEYLSAALATLENQRTGYTPVITQLFNLNSNGTVRSDGTSLTAVSWDPRHDAALMKATFGVNAEVIVSNTNASGGASAAFGLAVAGVSAAQGRYLVMGANPFNTDAAKNNSSIVSPQMDQFLKNSIQWLLGKSSVGSFKVALVQLDDSYWFMDDSATRAWLSKQYGNQVSFNVAKAYDGTKIANVLRDGADLVIVSQQLDAGQDATQIAKGVKAIMDAGLPVLYLQRDGSLNALGTQLFDLFQVQYAGDNYWSRLSTSNLNGASMVGRLPSDMVDTRETLTHLVSGAYSFTLAQVAADNALAGYQSEFLRGATAVRSMVQAYDKAATDMFQSCGRELPKLLVLAGDRMRQDIVYPLSTAKSSVKDFLRAFFADHSVYNVRKISPAQKDLGTFSRSVFNGVTSVVRTIDVISRPSFRGTGAYAMPGQTFRVTRMDSSAVATSVFVNSVREGSTQMWNDGSFGGYSRPRFLQSAAVPVKAGGSVYLTSTYGGPIQIAFDKKDIPVRLKFENVAEHPYWSSPLDDATFAAKLAAKTHDWVEVATDGFEMHSKADRFITQTLANPNWNTPAALAAATQRYTYNYTHILAGFQGDGIDKHPEVYGWATSKGLTLPTTDVVKHMNADVPTCGWGCSGNPYDAGWAFTPIGHGDLHELGHSLQSGRWQLKHGAYDYPNHAGTNFYAYYSQSRAYDEMGAIDSGQHGMPVDTIFAQLQKGYQAGDRVGTVSATLEKYFADIRAHGGDEGIDNSYTFFMQYMMQVRKKGLLSNGWHMIGRIHVIDRSFNEALKDQATWDSRKAAIGFGQMAFADAKLMSNNDFMAIAMSYTTGLDIRDYMAMWGFRISDSAASQIASFNLPAAERVYFAMANNAWVKGALTTRVDTFPMLKIDGTTTWPKVL